MLALCTNGDARNQDAVAGAKAADACSDFVDYADAFVT
jgi:hypothetical protein